MKVLENKLKELINMPEDFNKCRKDGGKIRTKKINSKQYMHICIINGKTHSGEVKDYKKVLKK